MVEKVVGMKMGENGDGEYQSQKITLARNINLNYISTSCNPLLVFDSRSASMGKMGRGLTDSRFVLFGCVWQKPHRVPIGLTLSSCNLPT